MHPTSLVIANKLPNVYNKRRRSKLKEFAVGTRRNQQVNILRNTRKLNFTGNTQGRYLHEQATDKVSIVDFPA